MQEESKMEQQQLPWADNNDEGRENYKVGGYHPVQIGEVFNNRKLGWGHFSTVWFCLDNKTNLYVALKIVRSDPSYTSTAKDEIELLKKISGHDPEFKQPVCHLLDTFEIIGPHGTHVCMVFEALGTNLLSLIRLYHYRGIPLPIVKYIAKQVLEALDYIHRDLKIIHTDLKPENILLCWPVVFAPNKLKKKKDKLKEQEKNSLKDKENQSAAQTP
ncbi:MAG: putative Serine/threonine-protein kinase SRPK [Streblomastix strix]|uniref:non-specific serine/threonine protein kinase n=1 Tax=Streblomastix strix TaxID=222440 RepID=A0A5J4VSH6_9EUKA|nr:MAG: putative Serine/threonine-protein kinase SRPK [Streblomastix strix]